MVTRCIGVKEFRQNMARVAQTARRRKERVLVFRKNEPLFELRPLSKKAVVLEQLLKEIREAEADVRAGRVYSQEQVEKMLGL